MYFAGIIHYIDDNGRTSCVYAVCANYQQLVEQLLIYSEHDNIKVTKVSCNTFFTADEADEFILSDLKD